MTIDSITINLKNKEPIAFNPNQKLINSLKNHNVEIVIERKDVIYHGLSTKQ